VNEVHIRTDIIPYFTRKYHGEIIRRMVLRTIGRQGGQEMLDAKTADRLARQEKLSEGDYECGEIQNVSAVQSES
jgi:anionic cell wall polymer biosynthesis LytR-Cps2A-Psr (LCP) family protein